MNYEPAMFDATTRAVVAGALEQLAEGYVAMAESREHRRTKFGAGIMQAGAEALSQARRWREVR